MVSAEGRTSLPLFPNPESLCGSCSGACCRGGIYIPLNATEYGFMRSHGAHLDNAPLPQTGPDSRGNTREYYQLAEDCPFLKDIGDAAICTIYDDPNKPGICSEFEAGSQQCLAMREEQQSLR